MERYDEAFLRVQMNSNDHPMSDVYFVIESLENLIMASIFGSISDSALDHKLLIDVRNILRRSANHPKAGNRFYPQFMRYRNDKSFNQDSRENLYFPLDYDGGNNLDIGMQIGINSWTRREIYSENPRLYNVIFSFASVKKLEHHSPLLIELAITLGGVLLVPPLLVWGCCKVINSLRKGDAEVKIRETEVKLKEEELMQQRIKTDLMNSMREVIKERIGDKNLEIPEAVLAETARIAQTTVSDFRENISLIKEVNIGLSPGGKS